MIKTIELHGIEFEIEYDPIEAEEETNAGADVEILNVEHNGKCFWELFTNYGFEELKNELLTQLTF